MEWELFETAIPGIPNGASFYLYGGIILLACFAIIHYYLYMRLRDTGYNKTIFNFLLVEVPVDYLRRRAKYGWSPWPAYLMWPFLLIGCCLFVIGVFRL
jgi:hypothetical protein